MFERRLKILLLLLVLAAGALLLRAFAIQVVRGDRWAAESAKAQREAVLVEAPRGRLLDYKGREIAVDRPVIDVRVDYRAIAFETDPKWLTAVARSRLRLRDDQFAARPRAERVKLLADESEAVRQDLASMWRTLAKVAGKSEPEMRQQRQAIVDRVTTIKRIVRDKKQAAADQAATVEKPWYVRLFGGGRRDVGPVDVAIAEETRSHIIIPDVDYADYTELAKNRSRYPGFDPTPTLRRTYPFGHVAAQALGRMGAVDYLDIQNDPAADDDLRRYLGTDTRGKAGLEAMLEQQLRGRRGREVTDADGATAERVLPQPGADARVTLDFELQAEIEAAFNAVEFSPAKGFPVEKLRMNGAAVVIDIATGEVRALVSAPTYDPNTLDQNYTRLVTDNINDPLLNRATSVAREPGSTVKPIVGLAAITEGLIPPDARIECNGYLRLDGRQYSMGRCWTMSQFGIGHHAIPVPHATGHLNFPEALERSCNVFFETLGDQFQIEGLRTWFDRFGLGRPTGVGLPEARGRLPALDTPRARRRSVAWFAAIGQDQMAATPIQMANVAATIAREGVWERPTLVPRDAAMLNTVAGERVDLRLNRQAVAMAQEGMFNVVNGASGTGTQAHMDTVAVAGKTGSAQSAPLRLIRRDDTGKPLLDARDRRIYEPVTLGTSRGINPLVPWYRGVGKAEDHLPAHAWTIGFAPRSNPQIAFAVLVDYGGSGGQAAGSVAKKLLEACQRHGYLSGGQTAAWAP